MHSTKFGRILAVTGIALATWTTGITAKSISVPSAGIKTIAQAVARVGMGDTVWVENGVYHENVLLASNMTLLAREPMKSVLNGGGRGTVVTLTKNSTVSGFEIRNGTIGVFSDGEGNVIRNCRIVNNWMTGIITVRHLPKIEDNIIAFNRASGIQGWDVRSTTASINHNTIGFNGNHGIAVGGGSNIVVENNVIAYNERFGLKILAEAEGGRITNNNIFRNLPQPLPKDNFSFDPAFVSPRSNMNFQSDPRLCCQIKGSDGQNLGARLVY